MKKYSLLLPVLLVVLLPSFAYPSSLGGIRTSLIEGDVQIWTEDAGDWVPASVNMPLREGDRVWVPEGGRAELQLRDGTSVRLDESSSLEILRTENDDSQFYLSAGRAYAYFRGRKGSMIQIDTPIASVRAYDAAVFKVDVNDEDSTEISVLKGSVSAETRNGKTRVTANKTLSLKGDDYAELMPIGPPDEWEKWNKERNRRLYERRYSSRYLPDELEGYSSEFDDNGKWVYAADYGYVWTPTVMVAVDWSPYRHGRWVWIGGDYVWVGYESWGWVPYHYGRWSFIASIGWCWVPPVRGAVYWGPGFVGWVHTNDYVSWVPLAPGEVYYGYGHYGPHSVNLLTEKVVMKQALYRNARVHNAVAALSTTAFLTGRKDHFVVRDNPFLAQKVSIGRPQLKPERATLTPVIKDISRAKLPPQKVRSIEVKTIRETRPLVKNSKMSVFSGGAQQKSLPVRSLQERSGRDAGTYERRQPVTGKQFQAPEKQQRPEVPLSRTTKDAGRSRIEKPEAAQKPAAQQSLPLKKPESVHKSPTGQPQQIKKPEVRSAPGKKGSELPLKPKGERIDVPKEEKKTEEVRRPQKQAGPPPGSGASPDFKGIVKKREGSQAERGRGSTEGRPAPSGPGR